MKGYEPIDGGDVVLINASQVPLNMASDSMSDLSPADMKALIYGTKAD